MREKQFAFIPWWILPTLGRNNLKKEDLLSFETVCKHFSTEDITSLVALSHLTKYFVKGGVECDITHWYDRWASKGADARTQAALNDIINMANDAKFQDDLLLRLCSSNASLPLASKAPDALYSTKEESSESFEVSLMGDFGVAVVIKPGFNLIQHLKNSDNLIRGMIKQLYVYEDYQLLMARQIGRSYVESLMH